MQRPYDLAVAYRVYPGISQNGFPGVRDKGALVAGCLRSFKAALGDLHVKIWAILDGCPDSYAERFQAEFDDVSLVRMDRVGNAKTFLEQISVLCGQTASERIYLAEDDYVYLPGALERMVRFLETLPDTSFLSAYDHPDSYRVPVSMSHREVRLHGGQEWHTVVSTCLTFMTRRTTLERAAHVLRTFARGNHDSSIWHSLTKTNARAFALAPWKLGADTFALRVMAKAWWFGWKQIIRGPQYTLWVPVPSLATHLDPACLAPKVDWNAHFRELGIPGLLDEI